MRGVCQCTTDIVALAREILAEDQPGAVGAYPLAGWSALPKCTTPTNVSSGQDRKGSEILPHWRPPRPAQASREPAAAKGGCFLSVFPRRTGGALAVFLTGKSSHTAVCSDLL